MDHREQRLREWCRRFIVDLNLRTGYTQIHGEWAGEFGVFFGKVRDKVAQLNPALLGNLVVTDPIFGKEGHICSISCLRPRVFGMFPFPEVNLGPDSFRAHLIDMVTCVMIVAISNYLSEESRSQMRNRAMSGI